MRKRHGGRVYGPYANRRGWRVVAVAPDGTRRSQIVATEAAAKRLRRDIEEELAAEAVTVSEAIDLYGRHLEQKGNRPRSIDTTIRRLRAMLSNADMVLVDLTANACMRLYEELRARPTRSGRVVKTDTHRNTLTETRTFLRWAGQRGWVHGDPMAKVKGIGRRRRGKPQLRIDEARALMGVAIAEAAAGELGGLAAALALVVGLRATEIVSLEARDVDDGGQLIWVAESQEGKTESARRRLEAPEPLAGLLSAARAAAGNGPVFPGRDRHWVLREVRRLCRMAGVPEVCTHGLRGTHASIAQDQGTTGHVVAGALGHASEAVTAAHYTRPDAAQRGRARRAAAKLRLVP
jgi:integrase